MTYSGWDALKDFLGAVGPILIAFPWFRDFWLRRRKEKISGVSAAGRLARLKGDLEASLKQTIETPKMADFVWTVLGLSLIFMSFVIALVHGLSEHFHW